jgi:general secretion pathway protein N
MKKLKRGPRWWHSGLFVVAFAATVLVALPAHWAAAVLERATDGRIQVAAATGSPWLGRGDLILRVDGGEVALGRASWRWLPRRLLVGELALELHFEGLATGGAVVARRMSGVTLRDTEVRLPAAVLAERVAPLRSWSPGGTLVFRTDALALGPGGAAGGAELVWQGASTASAPLGDYQCVLQAVPGSAAQVTVATLRGPLHLSAAGEGGAGGALRLRGTATPDPAYRDRLGPLLLALGADRGDGAVAFDIALPPGGPA